MSPLTLQCSGTKSIAVMLMLYQLDVSVGGSLSSIMIEILHLNQIICPYSPSLLMFLFLTLQV